METTRFILLVALGLVLTMIWQAWQDDYGDVSTPVVNADQQVAGEALVTVAEDIPDLQNIVKHKESIKFDPLDEAGPVDSGDIVRVKTDVFDLEINSLGATVQYLALLQYPISKKQLDQPVVLLNNQANDFYLVQGGLLSKAETANHKTVFRSDKSEYQLGNNEELKVPFVWESDSGLTVIKTFTFYKGQYIADVDYQIINDTAEEWVGSAYAQLNRTEPKEGGSKFIYTYTGAVLSSPEKRYEKIDFGDIQDDKLSINVTNGWAAMLQHYFLTALIPGSKEEQYRYYTLNPKNKSYVIGASSPVKTVVPGSNEQFNHRVYFGPKLQKDLEKIADGLELSVDYGIFWFIAKPLYWVMDHIHTVVNNWGWSIVLVTLFLKLLFFKLSAAGYRSMANMRRVQPRLLSIRDRYKDDRARLNKAMMDIYKEEKINPLGGCFPILIQIPVFISLYWVLLESVELRQADFILWIHDLSIPDPYFVLPLIMGVTMFIQQKLNPAPMDPVQEKVMSVLPVVFTVFFAFFPSGLVLYWVVNNILSIAQQWVITRNIEQAGSSK